MKVVATVAPIALLATSCGGKPSPYAASLAKGSEHVVLHGILVSGVETVPMTGSGDFTNHPDRGTLTLHAASETLHEVLVGHTLYVKSGKRWRSQTVSGVQTPAQILKAHVPAKIEGGLVRRVVLHNASGTATIVFSRYGEHVSVSVPSVKGAK